MAERRIVFVGTDYILDRCFDGIADELAGQGVEVIRGPRVAAGKHPAYAPEDYPRLFGQAEAMLVTTRTAVPASLLDAAPRLRGVVFPSVGVETIDLAGATARGLVVAHGPTPEIFISMAEATVTLIATLLLGLRDKERQLALQLPRPDIPNASMVRGRVIGLVGLGRIGCAVAERFAGWGVQLLACDPRSPMQQVPSGIRKVELATLLAESDVVSLHATVTAQSRHLIGERELGQMKPTAFLVNTARGALVDESALAHALAARRIAGAALDTFEREPLPQDSPLRRLDNVILTNHCAGHTREILAAIAPTAMDNITRVLAGMPPRYTANPEVLPRWMARFGAPGAGTAEQGTRT